MFLVSIHMAAFWSIVVLLLLVFVVNYPELYIKGTSMNYERPWFQSWLQTNIDLEEAA